MERELAQRFARCNVQLLPHLQEVLRRMPHETASSLLDDTELQIVSKDPRSLGLYVSLREPVKHVILLDESLLDLPGERIRHVIAHELAHHVARDGKTKLWELEAERLAMLWGFGEETEETEYRQPALEEAGLKTGYSWAQSQPDLSFFEEFIDEWSEDGLPSDKLWVIFSRFDPMSVLAGEGPLPGRIQGKADLYVLCQGVLAGIMTYLVERKALRRTPSL